jgi:hypothetical protein
LEWDTAQTYTPSGARIAVITASVSHAAARQLPCQRLADGDEHATDNRRRGVNREVTYFQL